MNITGSGFCAEFDLGLHNFSSLLNTKSGDEYIKHAPKFPIISIIVLENGQKRELYPEGGAVVPDGQGFTLEYSQFGGKRVYACVSFSADGDCLRAAARLRNDSDADIIEIIMPRLNGISLGDTHEDDVILYPHHAGERSENPVYRYKLMAEGQWGRHWRAASLPVDDYYRREINYCGLASMSWMYYHDAENGLYVGSHDPRFPVTGVIAETSGDQTNPWMGFAFRKHHRVKPGEEWDCGSYCIAVSTQDWHYGAKIYREYINPHLDIQPSPDFLADETALHQCYNFKHSGKITRQFSDIPDIYARGAEWGVRHLFLASWNRTGFDSSYPEYYPDMELGSAMEFKRGLSYVREQGGFSTLYINARIFDLKSDFHATLGERMAIRTPDGCSIEEVYGPAHFTVSCPSDKLWSDYLVDTADFAALAYGCKGIYLDQLASAEPYPCYSEEHSHENTGRFNQGYLDIMRRLLKRLRERDPQAYLMVENCGDIYGCYCWGSLTWNGDCFDEHFNLFKYTFPEYVQVNMVDPRGWEQDPDQQDYWFYRDMQRAVLLGSILWLGITDHLENREPHRSYAKRALGFRNRIQPHIRSGVYLDNAYVSMVSGDCDASCWQLQDGKILLLAGNHLLKEDATAVFRLPAQICSAQCRDMDGNRVDCEISGDSLTIPLDGGRLFEVVVTLGK